MADVDVHWIVRQMIGSDAKDFSTPGDHVFGGEALRAENICLPRTTGGYSVDHVSLSVRAGEIVGVYGLMGAGRSEFLECVMGRHPMASGRNLLEGRLVRESGLGANRARPCADPRGSSARRLDAHPVRGGKSHHGEPRQTYTLFPHSGPRRSRSGGKGSQGAVNQSGQSRSFRFRRCLAETSRRW